MKKLNELALIARCVLNDDREAFGLLVEAYQPQLRRFFLNLTLGDESLSDDLSQETFIKAYINLRNFKGLSSFSTWLYRIGYNEFYTQKRQRQETLMETLPDHDTDNAIERLDASLTVQEALRHLSEHERAVVTLFYIEDLNLGRIAQALQMPQGTVKSHLHRARAKLNTMLKKE